MCVECFTAGIPDEHRIVELRFQARVHGRFTDDLVCTLENAAGDRSRALMQMKSGLTARKSDTDFRQALGNAWLDYQATDFDRNADLLLIVHDMTTKSSMNGATAVASTARSSLRSDEWLQKLLAPATGNEQKRQAYASIKAAVDLYAKRAATPDELHAFMRHVHFVAHDLESDETPEVKSLLQHVRVALPGQGRIDPGLVWSRLVTSCMELNELAGAVDHDNLKTFIGSDLAASFSAYRAIYRQSSVVMTPPHSPLSALMPAAMAALLAAQAVSAVVATIQGDVPPAKASSINKLVSSQLDHINTKLKAGEYRSALADLEQLGSDQREFDAHQKARWHLLRGICYWHLIGDEEAATEFMKAADLYEDDDKIATARARAHLLRKETSQAIAVAQAALERFPNSLSAWIVLANAQMIEGRVFSESDIPVSHRDQADAYQLVACSLKGAGRGKEAARLALKALALPTKNFFVADVALVMALENAAGDGLRVAYRMFNDEDRRDLSEAVAAFEPRMQKLWAMQAPRAVGEVVPRLGMAYLMLGRHEDALALVEEAKANGIDRSSLYRVEIGALAAAGKISDAIAYGRRAVDDLPTDSLVALGQLASNHGELEAIEAALNSARTRGLENRAIDALQALRWDAMLDRPPTRLQALEEVRRELSAILAGTAVSLLAIAGRALAKGGTRGEADPVIERAASLVTADSDDGEVYLVAMLMLETKNFARGADLLDRVLVKGQFTELHVYRLQALLKSRQWAKARRFIETFPQSWVHDDRARHLAIELGQRAADWEFLSTLVEPQIARAPNAANSWSFKFLVLLHTKPDSLPAVVAQTPERLEGSVEEIIRVASVELANGAIDKAMRRLYRMRRTRFDDSEAAAGHVSVVLVRGDRIPLLDAASDEIGPGTSAVLVSDEGQSLVRTIDPADCVGLPPTEEFRSATSEEAARLAGLRLNSTLRVREPLTGLERTYRVAHIESAHRRLLDLSGQAIAQSLNPPKAAAIVPLGKNKDGDFDFSELTRQLTEHSDETRRLFELYRSTPLTIGGLGRLLRRDCFELVRGWGQQDVSMFVCVGSPEEREAAANLFRSGTASFVIDAATLTELAMIECLHCLELVPRMLVSSRTRDLVAGKLAELGIVRQGGTAFVHEGQLAFREFSDADRLLETRFLLSIERAINDHCEVLPAYGPLDASGVPAELGGALSGEEYSAVMLALQEGANLLSLDMRLRNIAGMFSVRSAWPQVLLTEAHQRKQLSARDYSVACVKMFFGNRTHVSLGPNDLRMMTYQGFKWLDFGVRRFADQLGRGDIEFWSGLRVSMQYLGHLFLAGRCHLGVIVQLLPIFVQGLKTHKDCPAGLPKLVTEGLIEALLDAGKERREYLEVLVAEIFKIVGSSKQHVLQIDVLKVASPPCVYIRKGKSEGLVEAESAAARSSARISGDPEPGTSSAPDRHYE